MHDIEELFRPKCTVPGLCFISHTKDLLRLLDNVDLPETASDARVAPALLRTVFVRMIDTFALHLVSVFEACLMAQPQKLRSTSPVSVEQVLEFEDMRAFADHLAKQESDRLARADLKQQVEIFQQRLGIALFDDYRKHEAVRNLIRDRASLLASHEYPERQDSHNGVHLESEAIRAASELLSQQAARVDQLALDRYRLPFFDFDRNSRLI